jgi:hypothetical protein
MCGMGIYRLVHLRRFFVNLIIIVITGPFWVKHVFKINLVDLICSEIPHPCGGGGWPPLSTLGIVILDPSHRKGLEGPPPFPEQYTPCTSMGPLPVYSKGPCDNTTYSSISVINFLNIDDTWQNKFPFMAKPASRAFKAVAFTSYF